MRPPCYRPVFTLLLTLYSLTGTLISWAQQPQDAESVHIRAEADKTLSGIIAKSGRQIQAGAYDSAILTCRQGIPLCNNTDAGKLKLSSLYNYIGASFQFKGDFDSAVSYFYDAVKYAQQADSSSLQLLRIYNNLSLTFTRTLDRDKALLYLEKAEQLAKDNKLDGILVAILLNKGRIYKELGHLALSEQTFQRALQLSMVTKDIEQLTGVSARVTRLMLLTNLGQLYFTQNKFAAARKVLEEALPLSDDANPYYQLPVRIALGRTYFKLNNGKAAEANLLQAIAIAGASKINDGLAEGHYYLAELYNARGEGQKAYDHLLKSYDVEEMIRGDSRTKDSRLLEVKYRTAQKDKEIAEKKLAVVQKDRLLKTKNTWIAGISIGSLLLGVVLLGVYKNYKHRQRLQEQKMLAIEQSRHIELLKATAAGEEKERSRIAGNLHDGIGSIISAAKMNFSTLHTLESDKAVFDKSMKLLNDAAFELRTTAHNLMPQMLLQEGLLAATKDFCERVSNSQSLAIEYQAYGNIVPQDKNVELFIYRIIQELVNNIIKHSGASKALVQLSMSDELLAITVEDNGKGIQPGAAGSNKGAGLKSLEEKIRMLNGQLTMESAAGKGTQVYIEFDLYKTPISN
jgi:signal transduction histidine kinase/Tfp pilus assembly protein PilF